MFDITSSKLLILGIVALLVIGPKALPALLRTIGKYMNINFPDREPDDVAGVSVTSQGRRDPGLLHIEERQDTWGNPYYWLAFARRRSMAAEGSDLSAVYAGRISVTPLYLDLTHHGLRKSLQAVLAKDAG